MVRCVLRGMPFCDVSRTCCSMVGRALSRSWKGVGFALTALIVCMPLCWATMSWIYGEASRSWRLTVRLVRSGMSSVQRIKGAWVLASLGKSMTGLWSRLVVLARGFHHHAQQQCIRFQAIKPHW